MTSSYPTIQKTISLLFRLFMWAFVLLIPYAVFEFTNHALSNNLAFKTIYLSAVVVLANLIVVIQAINRVKRQESQNILSDWKNLPISFLYWSLIGTVAFVFLIDPLEKLLPFSDNYQQYFTTLLNIKGYSFLVVVVIMPILGEILFRGIILRGYLKNYTPLKAILLSAFFFGIIHFNVAQFITAFLIGLFLGYLYWQTKSLSLCIVIHIAHNAIFYIAFHVFKTGFSIESAIANTLIYLLLYFIAAVTLTLVILMIYKKNLSSVK